MEQKSNNPQNYPVFTDKLMEQISQLAKQSVPTKEQMDAIFSSTSKLTNMIKELMKQIDFKAIFDSILPPLRKLSIDIQNAKGNSDSLLNYLDYTKKLAQYYWVIPYNINTTNLKEIFENINSEKEFDIYMEDYFNDTLIDNLFIDIEKNIKKEHIELFRQINTAFLAESYALINNAIISIIDDELSYYIKDKQNTSRKDLFIPIIKDLSRVKISECNWINVLYLKMLNNNINTLFSKVNFNDIKINTNKSVRRHCTQHGKKYSNKRIDSLMLLNTLYHLLLIKSDMKEYEGALKYIKSNNTHKYILSA